MRSGLTVPAVAFARLVVTGLHAQRVLPPGSLRQLTAPVPEGAIVRP